MSKYLLTKYFGKIFIGFCLVLSFQSCKTAKLKSISAITAGNSVKEILTAHQNQALKFTTLQSRLRVNYNDGNKSLSPTVSLRMQHNKIIWLSVKVFGITVAKALITPNSVSFYEKLNKRYYKGDFSALSAFLGTKINFNSLQQLITGQSIVDTNGKFDIVAMQANQTTLSPKKESEVYQFILRLYNSNIKVSETEIVKKKDSSAVLLTYASYQKVDNQYFPETLQIQSKSTSQIKRIETQFKGVSINDSLTFPFQIPNGYTAYKLTP